MLQSINSSTENLNQYYNLENKLNYPSSSSKIDSASDKLSDYIGKLEESTTSNQTTNELPLDEYKNMLEQIIPALSKFSPQQNSQSNISQLINNSSNTGNYSFNALKNYLEGLNEEEYKNFVSNLASQEKALSANNALNFALSNPIQNQYSNTLSMFSNSQGNYITSYLNKNLTTKMYSFLRANNVYLDNEKLFTLSSQDIVTNFYEYFV